MTSAATSVTPAPTRRSRPTDLARSAAILLGAAILIFAVVLAVGFTLTRTAVGTAVSTADTGLVQWLVGLRTEPLDRASILITGFADTEVVIAGSLLVALVAGFVVRAWWPAVLIVVAVAGEVTLFLNAATVVGRSRPPAPHLDGALPPTSSFPSGHTAAAISLYGGVAAIVLIATRAWWRWLVLALAVVLVVAVAVARVYRAAHFPTDVLGAALLTVPWLLAVSWTVHPDRRGRSTS